MATVILLRHGRTSANASGTLAGRTPGVRLDDVGRTQADRAAERLSVVPLAELVTSPLERCRETAKAVASRQAAKPRVHQDKGLTECDYGEWQGRKLRELARLALWKTVQTNPSAATFPGYTAGPQFPGQQYPGQPYPGAYAAEGRPAEPTPADQWTGEHAYGQNARYGGQYGVPGYPPPPPYGAPGYEPPTIAVGAEACDTASPPRGTRPVTEPVVDAGTGSHRAASDPGASTFRSPTDAATGTGSHRAVPDPGTGSFRALPHAHAAETAPVSGTGAHRSASSGRPADDDSEHTTTLPTVSDEPRH